MNSKEHQKIQDITKDIKDLSKQIKKDYQTKKYQIKMNLGLQDTKNKSTDMNIFKYSLAQAIARIALLPFDVLKTKHQAMPNLYSNLVKGLANMRQNGHLMMGLSPSFLKYFIFSFMSGQEVKTGFLPSQAYVILSPLIISSLLFPLESIKLRMQLSQPGTQFPRSFLKASQHIQNQKDYYKHYQGLSRFFKGFTLMFIRDLIYYSTISTTLHYTFSLAQSMMIVAGAIILSHPFDTLLTNVYHRKTDSRPNVVLAQIYKQLGMKGLYRGIIQRMIFLGGGIFTTLTSMYCLLKIQSI